jgi:type II secretory pathway pseudopilin PulG
VIVPPRRRAFTTIELLVVISIIILLGGILLFAVSAVLRTAKEHATKVQFENATALLSEFSNTVHLNVNSRPSTWYFQGVQVNLATDPNAALLDFWHVPEGSGGSGAGTPPTPLPLIAPGSVDPGSPNRDGSDSSLMTADDGVLNTVIAFNKFQSIPANRTAMSKLPSDKLYSGDKNKFAIPILLDAWNNPIIFVPGSGLQTTVNGSTIVITAPDKQPFFASAGPDGDFTHGDDNVYSFEK